MSLKNRTIGHYILEKKIGHGAFSTIELATHDIYKTKVAIKMISKNKMKIDPNFKKCLIEIDTLKHLTHPNIVQLFEVLESEKFMFLVIEYCKEGDLYTILNNKTKFTENEARHYFRQIIRAMIYCHSMGYAHRDLKLENIFLTSFNKIKIGDFGLANLLVPGELMSTSCGSLRYASPEVINGKKYSGELADVWSCGIILFTFLAGYHPFDDDSYVSILKKIMRNQYVMPSDISIEAVDLIKRILEVILLD